MEKRRTPNGVVIHCAGVTKEERGKELRANGIFKTPPITSLCGKETRKETFSFDFIDDFLSNEVYEKCEECVNHPDLPLMLLRNV